MRNFILKEFIMTKYGEILMLASLRISQANIATSCSISKKTANRVLQRAKEARITWPLSSDMTDEALAKLLSPLADTVSKSGLKMPDFNYVHNKLNRKGIYIYMGVIFVITHSRILFVRLNCYRI